MSVWPRELISMDCIPPLTASHESKIWPWVQSDWEPRMIVLARTGGNLPVQSIPQVTFTSVWPRELISMDWIPHVTEGKECLRSLNPKVPSWRFHSGNYTKIRSSPLLVTAAGNNYPGEHERLWNCNISVFTGTASQIIPSEPETEDEMGQVQSDQVSLGPMAGSYGDCEKT
jgi:hypothetical protein